MVVRQNTFFLLVSQFALPAGKQVLANWPSFYVKRGPTGQKLTSQLAILF